MSFEQRNATEELGRGMRTVALFCSIFEDKRYP